MQDEDSINKKQLIQLQLSITFLQDVKFTTENFLRESFLSSTCVLSKNATKIIMKSCRSKLCLIKLNSIRDKEGIYWQTRICKNLLITLACSSR